MTCNANGTISVSGSCENYCYHSGAAQTWGGGNCSAPSKGRDYWRPVGGGVAFHDTQGPYQGTKTWTCTASGWSITRNDCNPQ